MKFLLVLSNQDVNSDWHNTLGNPLKKSGGEVRIINTLDEAVQVLAEPEALFDEVICGSFGGIYKGDWRRVQSVAKDRGIRISLLTGDGVERDFEKLRNEGVKVIDKYHFHINDFLAERFPVGGVLKEIR